MWRVMVSSAMLVQAMSAIVAHAAFIDQTVLCKNCSIEAGITPDSSQPWPPSERRPQAQFSAECPGLIERTETPSSFLLQGALADGADPKICPLQVSIYSQVPNTLHSENGSIHFSGFTPEHLTLIADNGDVLAENGSDDYLTVIAANGSVTLKHMQGRLSVTSANGEALLERCYGYKLKANVTNGNVTARSLVIANKDTAVIEVNNGSIKLRKLSSPDVKRGGRQRVTGKVIVKARATNGVVKDFRPARERILSKAEKVVAGKLRLTVYNGDIVLR